LTEVDAAPSDTIIAQADRQDVDAIVPVRP
jgi:hypothetical protein